MFRNEKQRREFCSRCSLARVANLVGDSCVLLIIRDLLLGPKRFSDLQSSLSGISTRTLSRKLKDLQNCDLVTRRKSREKLPRALYSLTKKGRGLRFVTNAMRRYSERYL